MATVTARPTTGADDGVAQTATLFAGFDHYNTPLGPDGTPFEYFETIRDAAIRSGRPIGWSEAYGGFWVVAGWPESRAIHENTADFSNVATTFPQYATPSGKPFFMSGQDAPEHGHYRRMVQPPFTRPRARGMLGKMQDIARMLVDRIIDQDRFDICETSDLMPGYAFCALVGLSMDDAPKFRRYVGAMVEGSRFPEKAAADLREMEEFWTDLLKLRRREPNDGLLSEIIHAEYNGEKLTDGELLEFFTVLLIGGFDNMLRFFGNAFYRLAWNRELRRRLVRHPELIPNAVEEFLRLDAPACTFRLVRNPVSIGGVDMQPGQVAGLIHPVTNRDPRQFEFPDAFVIERKPNPHTTFGYGVHHCLGAFLAQVEAIALIEEFLKRIPDFELDQSRETRWVCGQVAGMHEVPVIVRRRA